MMIILESVQAVDFQLGSSDGSGPPDDYITKVARICKLR